MLLAAVVLQTNCTTKYSIGNTVYQKIYMCPVDMQCYVDKTEVPYLNKCAFDTLFKDCEKLCKGECMHGVNSTVKNITLIYEKGKREETEEQIYADTITMDFYYCKYKKLRIYEIAYISIGVSVAIVLICTATLLIVLYIIRK